MLELILEQSSDTNILKLMSTTYIPLISGLMGMDFCSLLDTQTQFLTDLHKQIKQYLQTMETINPLSSKQIGSLMISNARLCNKDQAQLMRVGLYLT